MCSLVTDIHSECVIATDLLKTGNELCTQIRPGIPATHSLCQVLKPFTTPMWRLKTFLAGYGELL